MSELDLNGTNANKSGEAPTTGEELNHDQYYLDVVANETTARLFFSSFLHPLILEQIDLSTLRTIRTRAVDSNGVETIDEYSLLQK